MSPAPALLIRAMLPDDLDAVLQIQRSAYAPEFHESRGVFSGKLARYPRHAWIVEIEGKPCAYLFAQPARHGSPPPLNDSGPAITETDTLHLHDMAILPQAQGQGIARQLMRHALDWGKRQGYARATLVAVQDSAKRWQRYGFRETLPEKSLASYGEGAAYMTLTL